MTPGRLDAHMEAYRIARQHPLMPACVGEALDAIPELVDEMRRLESENARLREAERYPPNWRECTVHYNPETAECHIDGDGWLRDQIRAALDRKEQG